MSGEVFYAPGDDKMSLDEARQACEREEAVLASPGHLHAAWRSGMDRCDYGWLSDGSARYPVSVPRMQCGRGQLGVRTMYRYLNQTGFPSPNEKLGAYCFKGTVHLHSCLNFNYILFKMLTAVYSSIYYSLLIRYSYHNTILYKLLQLTPVYYSKYKSVPQHRFGFGIICVDREVSV